MACKPLNLKGLLLLSEKAFTGVPDRSQNAKMDHDMEMLLMMRYRYCHFAEYSLPGMWSTNYDRALLPTELKAAKAKAFRGGISLA